MVAIPFRRRREELHRIVVLSRSFVFEIDRHFGTGQRGIGIARAREFLVLF